MFLTAAITPLDLDPAGVDPPRLLGNLNGIKPVVRGDVDGPGVDVEGSLYGVRPEPDVTRGELEEEGTPVGTVDDGPLVVTDGVIEDITALDTGEEEGGEEEVIGGEPQMQMQEEAGVVLGGGALLEAGPVVLEPRRWGISPVVGVAVLPVTVVLESRVGLVEELCSDVVDGPGVPDEEELDTG